MPLSLFVSGDQKVETKQFCLFGGADFREKVLSAKNACYLLGLTFHGMIKIVVFRI